MAKKGVNVDRIAELLEGCKLEEDMSWDNFNRWVASSIGKDVTVQEFVSEVEKLRADLDEWMKVACRYANEVDRLKQELSIVKGRYQQLADYNIDTIIESHKFKKT